MRGASISYRNLGKLLEMAREKSGYTREEAATLLGLSGRNFICNIEHGKVNFPMKKLKRALDLYEVKADVAIEAIVEDTVKGLGKFLKGGK